MADSLATATLRLQRCRNPATRLRRCSRSAVRVTLGGGVEWSQHLWQCSARRTSGAWEHSRRGCSPTIQLQQERSREEGAMFGTCRLTCAMQRTWLRRTHRKATVLGFPVGDGLESGLRSPGKHGSSIRTEPRCRPQRVKARAQRVDRLRACRTGQQAACSQLHGASSTLCTNGTLAARN